MNKFIQNFIPYRFWPSTLVRRWIEYKSKGEVLCGPFSGMKYVTTSVGSSYEPKLLGTYELELNNQIHKLISSNFQTIVDVGAAEGYYAIGMAIKCQNAQIVAFESSVGGRELLAQMAALNGVQDRLTIKGVCDISSLEKFLPVSGETLLIMDIEGAEKKILNPVIIPKLYNTHILVEIHDYADAEIGELILSRFAQSHSIEKISIICRSLTDYPLKIPTLFKLFLRNAFLDAISEHRHSNSRWFYMIPNPIADSNAGKSI